MLRSLGWKGPSIVILGLSDRINSLALLIAVTVFERELSSYCILQRLKQAYSRNTPQELRTLIVREKLSHMMG